MPPRDVEVLGAVGVRQTNVARYLHVAFEQARQPSAFSVYADS